MPREDKRYMCPEVKSSGCECVRHLNLSHSCELSDALNKAGKTSSLQFMVNGKNAVGHRNDTETAELSKFGEL